MAGIGEILRRRVRSSSLVEVTTALVIIGMVFTIAMIIYLNVQRSGVSSLKLSSEIRMREIFNEAIRTKEFSNKEIKFENQVVYQEVIKNGTVEDLIEVKLETRDLNGKLLAERKHLVYVPDDQP